MYQRLFIGVYLLLSGIINAQELLVTNINDSGAGSLRQAVLDVEIAGTVIRFDNSLAGETITLLSPIEVETVISIQGRLEGARVAISGGSTTNIFIVDDGVFLDIVNLDFINGNAESGGAISVDGTGSEVAIMFSQFLNNTATSGAAINNSGGRVSVFSSVFSGNTADGVFSVGGAINNTGGGALLIRNSTFSGNNSLSGDGGAIANLSGDLEIANSTIVGNFAESFAGGISNNAVSSISNIRNTIVAGNNTESGNGLDIGNLADISAISSGGGNFIGAVQESTTGGTVGIFIQTNDQTGIVGMRLNPMLGELADNGGLTLSHHPLNGSLVIDAGVNINLPQEDQRFSGFQRLINGAVDTGSIEVQFIDEQFFLDGFEGLSEACCHLSELRGVIRMQ